MRNRRRVIFFFASLIGTTWVMNRMLTLERKHNSATMSSVEIDNLVENVVNERFGSISQGTELNFIDFHCNINRTKSPYLTHIKVSYNLFSVRPHLIMTYM